MSFSMSAWNRVATEVKASEWTRVVNEVRTSEFVQTLQQREEGS